MGVRFQCPNGHKLHVKAELAGRRGMCPECGAKFVVPSFSGGVAAEASGSAGASTPPPSTPRPATVTPPASIIESTTDSATSSVFIPTQTPPPSIKPPAPASTPAAVPNNDSVAWYVRPAAGGQFGPATTDVFQQWIEDGRVAADSWVWRTGWADWKAGSEALALLADRPPLEPVAAMAAAIEDRVGVMPVDAPTDAEVGTAEARRREIKRRKHRVRMISTVLAVVALAMLMALVFVLAR